MLLFLNYTMKIRPRGAMCRDELNECDIADYCSGRSALVSCSKIAFNACNQNIACSKLLLLCYYAFVKWVTESAGAWGLEAEEIIRKSWSPLWCSLPIISPEMRLPSAQSKINGPLGIWQGCLTFTPPQNPFKLCIAPGCNFARCFDHE